jgi:predicted metal-dependent phosphoesterase TrpH
MSEKYDLHSHSKASDGALNPTELVNRAIEKGVTTLALTDHDTTQGLSEAQNTAAVAGLKLIPGIEISTTWQNKCFHIIGLNIDPENQSLQQGLGDLRNTRIERAKKISTKLEKKKIFGAYEAVSKITGQGMITRLHFAEFLLANGYVSTLQEAFDRYLIKGKPAFVTTQWAVLEDTLNWITGAGGIAVLAHPLRYKITASWTKRFLTAFKDMGGQGIEIITGRISTDEIRRAAQLAKQFDLYGSVGSDFHNPKNNWVELGRLAPLPANINPVWELFN